MKIKATIKGTHRGEPASVDIEAEYTLTEMLGLLKAYPKVMAKVIKVVQSTDKRTEPTVKKEEA